MPLFCVCASARARVKDAGLIVEVASRKPPVKDAKKESILFFFFGKEKNSTLG